ncbi:serine hydrolase domain-containing protein [Streptomyces sp. NPDC041068]|uniref:serine hydrolase domain-containing protein n=1 Tax=Streptomyces sp. NPDC041068 TaxID=3155130 RepID=UPI0033F9A0BD
MLVEKAAGRPWQQEVESRILESLGMRHTYLPGTTPALRAPHAAGYQVFDSGERTDVTEQIVPDLGGSVSTTADVNRCFRGLLGGRLLSGARMAEQQDTVPIAKQFDEHQLQRPPPNTAPAQGRQRPRRPRAVRNPRQDRMEDVRPCPIGPSHPTGHAPDRRGVTVGEGLEPCPGRLARQAAEHGA